MSTSSVPPDAPQKPPQWKPLHPKDRRVIGTLVEKAKTTPEQYPLTLNGLVTGCNQKSNRDPQMNLSADDVEESLDRLRTAGAVTEVQGSGRTSKYRHLMYDWLGVSKVELSVMTELLLRGAQTEGELRGRAARMDPVPDLAALRTILDSLRAKGLVISLSPEGRGHVISHALYLPPELDVLKTKYSGGGQSFADDADVAPTPAPAPARTSPPAPAPAAPSAPNRELEQLRAEVSQLRTELEELSDRLRRSEDEIRTLKDSLGG